MALRIDGGRKAYSSALVSEAYLYAMNQGAKSVNTSYNIDGFPGDKAIESTYRTLADNDVLVFNSAGNSGRLNPARTVFEDIVLVASTDTAAASVDKRSSFSNYGVGIDIASPGKDIQSTLPDAKLGPLAAPAWPALARWAFTFWSRAPIPNGTASNAGLKSLAQQTTSTPRIRVRLAFSETDASTPVAL